MPVAGFLSVVPTPSVRPAVLRRVSARGPHSSSPRATVVRVEGQEEEEEEVDWVRVTDVEFFRHDSRPIILFDGVCNMCNGGVRLVRDNDRNRRMRFEALQSESGRKLLMRSGRSPDDISSIVLVDKDRSYIKSEAMLKIMEYLDIPFPQLALLLKMVPLFARDFAYDNVADNRYAIFGRSQSCDI